MPALSAQSSQSHTMGVEPRHGRILVIRHGAFGDLMQTDGALRDIRAHHVSGRITLLVDARYAGLMARCPHVDEVIPDPRASLPHLRVNLGLLERLRRGAYDCVYDLQGSDRTRIYEQLAPGSRPWNRRRNPRTTTTPDREALAVMLEAAGVPVVHARTPDVSWMAVDVTRLIARAGLAPGYVALVPGSAARHPHKRWNGFPELARRLCAEGRQVVFCPGPDEMELVPRMPCVALTDDGRWLDWFQLAGVLRAATFVVGNDTGPTHLAACLGTPGIALFGPATNAARTGLRMGRFDAIETMDLDHLDAGVVMDAVRTRLGEAA